MRMNQNETLKTRTVSAVNSLRRAECGERTSGRVASQHQAAFTLTELLVVITIIGILASLITVAGKNALDTAKERAITLEIQQLATAMEDFKNQHGSYPPNVFSGMELTGPEPNLNRANLQLFLKRLAPRSTEFKLVGASDPWDDNLTTISARGLSPAESIVFWLSGLSADPQRPLTGTDLTAVSIDDEGTTVNNVITIDSFQNPLYDFDRSRLRFSRDGNGDRRFLIVQRAGSNVNFQIQLYEYLADGSEEPFVYFDTSRDTPQQTVDKWETSEFFYNSRKADGGNIYPLKQLRPDAPLRNDWQSPLIQYVEYVQKNRFQILHCGIDDFWGNFSAAGALDVDDPENVPQLLFPTGPFLGEIADTLSNFNTENLANAQEE